MTEELLELFRQYAAAHHGIEPDGYDEICYDAITHDEFVRYIKLALKKNCELPDVVD